MSTRSRIGYLVTGLALAIALFVLREPLAAWFSGKPMGGHEGEAITASGGTLSIRAALDPDPPREKDQALDLVVTGPDGKAVDGAHVDLTWDMPAMGSMAEMKGNATIEPRGQGRYRATFDVPMKASWTLRATVQASAGSGSVAYTMIVGAPGLTTTSSAAEIRGGDAGGEIDHYTCSMHPSVRQKGPGKCPICGMDLIPVTNAQQQEGVVRVDEVRRQEIGVMSEPVTRSAMREPIRAIGRVAYDEAALSDVNLKLRGWIKHLYVDRTGQRVSKGQPLFTLYSPELYAAEQDYLLATRVPPGAAGAPSRTEYLATAARERLKLLDLTDAQIDEIGRAGKPLEAVPFLSPASGYVIEKNVVEGASVDAGMRLFRIAAMDRVWLEADVYEADLPLVKTSQPATVTLDYLPGKKYEARVAYVYPYLDEKARTGRVRFELPNRGMDLRPGMFANVELFADLGEKLQVPASAIIYTGPRRLVFVDLGAGQFKPQEVHVGVESNGRYEVLWGLEEGQRVVTSGVFLIAAESRISSAAKYWEPQESADAAAPAMSGAPPMPSSPMPSSAPSHGKGAAPPRSPSPPSTAPATSASSTAAPTIYTCPMHPEVRSTTPGKCPKCGMDLEPEKRAP